MLLHGSWRGTVLALSMSSQNQWWKWLHSDKLRRYSKQIQHRAIQEAPDIDTIWGYWQCLSSTSLARMRTQSRVLSFEKWANSAKRGDKTILSTKKRWKDNNGRSEWRRTKPGEWGERRREETPTQTRRLSGTTMIKRGESEVVTYCD